MTKRKIYKKVSVTLALLLTLSRINAGTPDSNADNKLLPDILSGKNYFPLLSDSGQINTDIKSFSSAAPVPIHPSIIDFADDYIEKNDDLFDKLKKNNSHTFKTIDKIFRQFDLPVELKYMAVVESKLKYNAVSKSGAVGLWQFMPATAKRFGMKISASYDDRKNTWKSTVAAAKYLNLLYDCFGDWLLVVAAYNSGPAPVLNAIKKSGSRNFWQLQYFLPKESRMHVKKFIATHFYFEGKGSLVTMGKTETDIYLKSLERNNSFGEINNETENNSSEYSGTPGWIAVLADEKYPKLILKK